MNTLQAFSILAASSADGLIHSLIIFLVVALVLGVIGWVLAKFITGFPMQVIWIILGLVLLLYALRTFDIL